jgi:hypothetical protein
VVGSDKVVSAVSVVGVVESVESVVVGSVVSVVGSVVSAEVSVVGSVVDVEDPPDEPEELSLSANALLGCINAAKNNPPTVSMMIKLYLVIFILIGTPQSCPLKIILGREESIAQLFPHLTLRALSKD